MSVMDEDNWQEQLSPEKVAAWLESSEGEEWSYQRHYRLRTYGPCAYLFKLFYDDSRSVKARSRSDCRKTSVFWHGTYHEDRDVVMLCSDIPPERI